MKREAIVIGINRYPCLRNAQGVAQHLTAPANDAEAIAQRLEQATGDYSWSVRRLPETFIEGKPSISQDTGIKQEKLKTAISNLLNPQHSSPPEAVLLFFAGHGLRQKQGEDSEVFLAASDTKKNTDDEEKQGISLKWLRQQLIESPIQKQIVWLDCCHSGELLNLTREEVERWKLGGDRCLIVASRSDRAAYSNKQHGALTHLLLQALDPQSHPCNEWISTWTITEFIERQREIDPLLKRQIPLCRHFGERIRFWQGKKPIPYRPRDRQWELKFTLSEHTDIVQTVAVSPNGKILASGSQDKTIKLWNLTTGELRHTLTGHSSAVLSLAFSPDGKTLASASNLEVNSSAIKLWDVETGKLNRTLGDSLLALRVSCIAFSPDSQFLASGQLDATIKLWHLPSGKVRQTLRGHGWDVRSLAFSRDGKVLVSGGMDGAVKIWNWQTGQHLLTLNRPSPSDLVGSLVSWFDSSVGAIWSVDISPDGKMIASGGSQQPIILWNAETGSLIRTLTQHSGRVLSVAFSPTGELLASGGEDNVICIWDVQSGELLNKLQHLGSVESVVFDGNGEVLGSGSADTTVKIWQTSVSFKDNY
ncbi:MAG: caspase family protein [Chroococcales cyanobacterium]